MLVADRLLVAMYASGCARIAVSPDSAASRDSTRRAAAFPGALHAATSGTTTAGVNPMARYGKKAQSKVKRAMHERKHGTLRSGRSGRKVKSRKQAIAIGLSEARRAGAKVPKKKKSSSRKKK